MLAPCRSLGELAKTDWDVVVVGAGPAGALAARALAQRGLAVLLVDRASFPRKKICGCCLNPSTLRILAKAGLDAVIQSQMPQRLEQMRLATGESRATIRLWGWQALSRERLDTALVEEAVAAGAQFLPGVQANLGMERENRRIVAVRRGSEFAEINGKLILAANGLSSSRFPRGGNVAQIAAVAVGRRTYSRDGPVSMSRASSTWPMRGGYVGLVRLEDGRLNIAAARVPDVKPGRAPGKVVSLLLRDALASTLVGRRKLACTPPFTRR